MSASSGDVIYIADNATVSNGQWLLYKSNAVSDYITFDVNMAQAGTYSISVDFWSHVNRGTIQLSVNGTNVGAPLDQYRTSQFLVTDVAVGSYSFNSVGNYTFTFTNVVRNASSGNHKFSLDVITLTPGNNARIGFEDVELVAQEEMEVSSYPNPFSTSTNIQFNLREAAFVNLVFYNTSGVLVADLIHEEKPAGSHTATWDAGNSTGVSPGMYIYQLKIGDEIKTGKLLFRR